MIPSRETEEKRQHSTPLIPYSSYEVRIPEALNNVPMHWHNEFEINLILRGAGEFIGISYDGTNYYKVSEEVDTSYLSRDKRKYLGYVYYNGKNYGSLYYVYDYKEQGKPALILGVYNSRSYRLFLMD